MGTNVGEADEEFLHRLTDRSVELLHIEWLGDVTRRRSTIDGQRAAGVAAENGPRITAARKDVRRRLVAEPRQDIHRRMGTSHQIVHNARRPVAPVRQLQVAEQRVLRTLLESYAFVGGNLLPYDDDVGRGKLEPLAREGPKLEFAAKSVRDDPRVAERRRSENAQPETSARRLELGLSRVAILLLRLDLPALAVIFAQDELDGVGVRKRARASHGQ